MNAPEQHNDDNKHENQPAMPQPTRTSQLKSAQTLVMIGIIGGPVSMLFGGVLLSIIALVCGIIGYCKVNSVLQQSKSTDDIAKSLQRQALVAIAVSAIAAVFNVVYLVSIMPVMLEMLQSGDFANLLSDLGIQSESSSASSASSIWG